MGLYGGGDSSARLRKEQQYREAKIKEAQQQVASIFSGFDEPFYEGRRQAYLNAVMPQLGQQFSETQRNLIYMLANKGLLKSSAAGQLGGSLQSALERNKRVVAEQATGQANELRGQVSDQQSQLMSQVLAGLSPSAARSQALAAASQVKATSPLTNVGNMFGDWASIYLASKALDEYRKQGGKGTGANVLFPMQSGVTLKVGGR